MSLAIRGLTNREVAKLVGSSPNTVRNTLVEVFRKVGVTRRGELAFIVQSESGASPTERPDMPPEKSHPDRPTITSTLTHRPPQPLSPGGRVDAAAPSARGKSPNR
jgi:hypothetical protein